MEAPIYLEKFQGTPTDPTIFNPKPDDGLGPLQIGDSGNYGNYPSLSSSPTAGGPTNVLNANGLTLTVETNDDLDANDVVTIGAFLTDFPTDMDYFILVADFTAPIGMTTDNWVISVTAREGGITDLGNLQRISLALHADPTTNPPSGFLNVPDNNNPGPPTRVYIPPAIFEQIFPPATLILLPDPIPVNPQTIVSQPAGTFTLVLLIDRAAESGNAALYSQGLEVSYPFTHSYLPKSAGPISTVGVALTLRKGHGNVSVNVREFRIYGKFSWVASVLAWVKHRLARLPLLRPTPPAPLGGRSRNPARP